MNTCERTSALTGSNMKQAKTRPAVVPVVESIERRLLLAAQPVLVKDLAADTDGSNPLDLVNVGGTLYFAADDGIGGRELYKSNGTAGGTTLVKDIRPGPEGSAPSDLVNVNGTLYFAADDGVRGRELWKSD